MTDLKILACMGDSQTSMLSPYGVAPHDVWGAKMSKYLNSDGAISIPKIFGVPGDTTPRMLARMGAMFMYGKPSAACISAGVNDAAFQASTGTCQAGSTANTIKLSANASGYAGEYITQVITTTAGTGSGQSRIVTAYDNASKICTVDSAWSVTPDATTTYSIAAPTQAVTQANIQAMVKCLKYAAYGDYFYDSSSPVVYSQTMLPAMGKLGQRYVVLYDTSTTGGVNNWCASQNANIGGDIGGAQSVWEYRNSRSGELGWGRVAITGTTPFSDGVSKIIIATQSYLNWSTGGDNYNVSTNSGTHYSNYVRVRSACTAAAAAESVKLCDVYAYQSMLIYGGTFEGATVAAECSQGDYGYHFIDQNQHYSAYGHGTVARAMYLSAVSDGWVSSLSS